MRNVLQDGYSPLLVYQIYNGFSQPSGNREQPRKKPDKGNNKFGTLLDNQIKQLS